MRCSPLFVLDLGAKGLMEGVCFATFVLPGGTVSGQFLNSPPPRKEVAITGGTGRCLGVRGQAIIVESSRSQTGTATFTLLR